MLQQNPNSNTQHAERTRSSPCAALAGIVALLMLWHTKCAVADNAPTPDSYIFGFSPFGTQELILNGGTITLNAEATGWYNNTGFNGSLGNYLAGTVGSATYNDFFVFDLSSISTPITSATLSIGNGPNGFFGSSPLTYSVWDVNTPYSSLITFQTSATAIFQDLGTGSQLGSSVVGTSSNNSNVIVNLDASALGLINSSLGSRFAVGGTAAPPSQKPPDLLFPLMSAAPVFLNTQTGGQAYEGTAPDHGADRNYYAIDLDVNQASAKVLAAAGGPIQTLDVITIAITDKDGNIIGRYWSPRLIIDNGGGYYTEYLEFDTRSCPDVVTCAQKPAVSSFSVNPSVLMAYENKLPLVTGQEIGTLTAEPRSHLHFQLLFDADANGPNVGPLGDSTSNHNSTLGQVTVGGRLLTDFTLAAEHTGQLNQAGKQGFVGFAGSGGQVLNPVNTTVDTHADQPIEIGMSSAGSMIVNGPITIDVANSITVGERGTLGVFNNALLIADSVYVNGGALRLGQVLDPDELLMSVISSFGVRSDVTVSNGGRIITGFSPGFGNIMGDLNFNGGVLEVDVAGLSLGEYDSLRVTGNANFSGGIIRFNFLNGFLPKEGDTIGFLIAGSLLNFTGVSFEYAGAAAGFDFSVLPLLAEGGGLRFLANSNASPVPLPSTLPLLGAALGICSFLRRRRKRRVAAAA